MEQWQVIIIVIAAVIALIAIVFSAFLPTPVSCVRLEASIRAKAERINYCARDSDCALESFGCPLGCTTYYNRSEKYFALKEELLQYNQFCGPCAVPNCAIPLPTACVEGKCMETPENYCSLDSDCLLSLCSGCSNKHHVLKSLPEPPCDTYDGYSCKCIDSQCVDVGPVETIVEKLCNTTENVPGIAIALGNYPSEVRQCEGAYAVFPERNADEEPITMISGTGEVLALCEAIASEGAVPEQDPCQMPCQGENLCQRLEVDCSVYQQTSNTESPFYGKGGSWYAWASDNCHFENFLRSGDKGNCSLIQERVLREHCLQLG